MKQYVAFECYARKPKTNVYSVNSKSNETYLGEIYWYAPWRQYIFEPIEGTVWSKGCLRQIADFIEHAMREQKNGLHGKEGASKNE